MVAILVRPKKFDLNFSLQLFVCQLRGQKRDEVPRKCPSKTLFDLAFIDRLVGTRPYGLIKDEKVHAVCIVKPAF